MRTWKQLPARFGRAFGANHFFGEVVKENPLSRRKRIRYNSNMNPATSTTWKYLAPNPKSAYKQLFIQGRRIRARMLYGMYMSAEEPMTPEAIAREYDLP